MTPTLFTARRASPLGEMILVWDEAGAVRVLDFATHEARADAMLARHGEGARIEPRALDAKLDDALDSYFSGRLDAFRGLAVSTRGTAFQEQVWQALRTIAPGQTLSYGTLAAQMKRPTAVRAVGLANSQNPVAIITPCHRVIGANGRLVGYAGGMERKSWLLAHEGVHLAH